MKFQILLIMLMVVCILPATIAESYQSSAFGLKASLNFGRQIPGTQPQFEEDDDPADNSSHIAKTFALPFEDVNLVINRILWNVFDQDGSFLYQQGSRNQDAVEIANKFTFREMRGFTVRARCSFEENDLIFGLAELDFELFGQGMINLPDSVSPAFIDAYKVLADNYDTSYLRDLPVARPKMLIISHAALENYIQEYITWKRSIGFDVMVVNRADIGNTVGTIKSFLTDHYHQHHCDYLLLLGDVNGTFSIPTAFFPSPEFQENDADDHQYTLIDGDDFFPEMLIGRFSFDVLSEYLSMANKTVIYEKTPFMSNTNWMKRALTVAGNYAEGGLTPTTPIHMSRWLREKMLNRGFAQVDTVYAPPTYPGTSLISTAINQGVQYVSYRGWGDARGWHVPLFHVENLNDVNSGQRMPIVFSIVCNTGDFANNVNPCFGEKWMRMGTQAQPNGCVAFVGPSDLHTKTRYNNTISSGAFRSIIDYGVRGFGSSVLMGKIELYKNFPTELGPTQYVAFYFHVYNLLADPSLNMWLLVPNTISENLLPGQYDASANHIAVEAENLEHAIVSGTKNNSTFTYSKVKNGVAYLPINPEEEGELTVTVSLPNFKPLVKTLSRVEDAGIGIVQNSLLDTFINPNQSVNASLSLKNYGDAALSLAEITFTGSEKLSVSAINAPASIAAGGTAEINFTVSGNADIFPRESLNLGLVIGSLPAKYFQIWGGGAEFTILNASGHISIGQSSNVSFSILNRGNASLTNAYATVVSLTEAASFGDQPIALGGIEAGSTKNFEASITTVSDTWEGRHIPIRLIISEDGYEAITYYALTAGTASTTSPTGPDPYGYYAYDSFDPDFLSTPIYDWVEIDPELGGSAEVFLCSDDGSRVVNIPFTFRFYGRDYNQITICSNGWISMGATDVFDFYNHYIPAALGPYSMIAGYWDDLKGARIGEDDEGNPIFANMRLLYWHDAVNNRYIVQWNDAYNQYNLTSLEKFQIILYPRNNADGDIVIQYHTVDNPGITSNYCTVGIENHNQTVGLTYTHANQYPPTATPLQDGLAIRFTTTAPDTYTSNDDLIQNTIFNLEQNYPNPFNPSTTISFELKQPAHAELNIYNLKGQLVKTLINEILPGQKHSIIWNGTDDNHQPVASGIYLYRLSAGGKTAEHKMLLIK